jgi:type I restriction enzyme S subunit
MSSIVPVGWNTVSLAEGIDILSGYSFDSSSFTDDSSKVGLIRIRDLVRQKVATYFDGAFDDNYLIRKGDVLIGMDGDFNIVKWNSAPGLLNQRICKVTVAGEIFDLAYLYQDLQKDLLEINNQTGSTTVKHLSVKDIRGIHKSYPPLPEQKKIASILTSVDEVIENTQKQIDKLQDLKKATMNELLTEGIGHTEFKDSELGRIPKSWEVVPVEELCSEIVDCVNKTAPVLGQPTPFKMIRTTNVRNGRIDIENVRFVSEETFKVWTRRGALKEGDIVFTREAPVGEYGLVTKPDGLFLGQRTMLYRPDETKTNPTYLMHCFATNLTKKQLEDMTGGSTVGHMRVPDCSKIKFLKCQLEEQNAIVKVLSSVDNRIEQVAIKLSQTKSLKKSLMQDLLTGKVRVTVN